MKYPLFWMESRNALRWFLTVTLLALFSALIICVFSLWSPACESPSVIAAPSVSVTHFVIVQLNWFSSAHHLPFSVVSRQKQERHDVFAIFDKVVVISIVCIIPGEISVRGPVLMFSLFEKEKNDWFEKYFSVTSRRKIKRKDQELPSRSLFYLVTHILDQFSFCFLPKISCFWCFTGVVSKI